MNRTVILLLTLVFLSVPPAFSQALDQRSISVDLGPTEYSFDVGMPDGWSVSSQRSRNSRTLVNVPPGGAGAPTANVQIVLQPRLDHEDALKRIRQYAAAARADEKQFLEIGGWPALQITRLEKQEKPDKAPALQHSELWKVYSYVAAGDVLYIITGRAAPDASGSTVQQLKSIANSLVFPAKGLPGRVSDELDQLRSDDALNLRDQPASGAMPRRVEVDTTPVNLLEDDGANDRINTSGFGELEIATSPDGQNVVVALQSRRWVSSNDGGATFPNSDRVGAGNGDPSVAWGQSGSFYMAWIDNSANCGSGYRDPVVAPDWDNDGNPDAAPRGLDCTGMARSDDNGLTFDPSLVNPAVVCIKRAASGNPAIPNECFPDQEHIAADRWNSGDSASEDQVYSTWRNFMPGSQDASLVCSSDSGVTWTDTTAIQIMPGNVFPRITVGQDGFVYVATYDGAGYQLWKFTSCSSGLNLVAGFPQLVSGRDPVQCPFSGHDRCDQNPSSQTVVVDDTDADHVYYAYADDRGNGSSGDADIMVRDSDDGGMNWSAAVRANEDVGARRIMPWLCATGGSAAVTWFQQPSFDPGNRSDTTDFFGARVAPNGGVLEPQEEFILSEVTDNWCDIGWRATTRWGNTATQTKNASEACPDQPQYAGQCGDGDNPNVTPDSGIRCDFSDDQPAAATTDRCPQDAASGSPSGNPEFCLRGGGVPKYGDYNGNACAGGKLFAAWASANAPEGLADPDANDNPGVLFDVINLDNLGVPVITVPGNVHFGAACEGDTLHQPLEVCNTGSANLQVDVITSDNPDFTVTVPSSGYPVTISPDFCFPFEVNYSPTGEPTMAILTIPSNDPDRPTIEVEADAEVDLQNLVTIMDSNFGDICLGGASSQQLTLLNDGSCDLEISDVSITNDAGGEFSLATVMSFPFTLKEGESISADVEFTPIGDVGAAGADVEIDSNDPDTPTKTLSLAGNSPPAIISSFIANSGSFSETCAGDITDMNLTVENVGACPLELDSVAIALGDNSQAGDFVAPDGNADGTVIEPGNSVQIPIRFTPSAFDNADPLIRNASVDVDSHTLLAITALPTDETEITGIVPPPDINLAIANSGNFGNVCKAGFADLDLTLFNQGRCDLTIDPIELLQLGGSFILPDDLDLPLVLSHDADFTLPVRYAPTECNDAGEAAQIKITSDDPDEPMELVDISGASPCPNLVIDPDGLTGDFAFPATVMDLDGSLGCYSERTTVLRNNGLCPLTIDSISSTAVGEFTVMAPSEFPVLLATAEETLEVTVRFTPQSAQDLLAPDEYTGQLTVVSDDPDGNANAALCGEGVGGSGIRYLVTDTSVGVPEIVDNVDSTTVRSKGKSTPSPINIQLTDVASNMATVCGNRIDWHVNLEYLPATQTTGSKGGKSQYEVSVKEGNLQDNRTFGLDQCEFSEFQMQVKSTDGDGGDDGDACPVGLKKKGEACDSADQCCSGKCKGKDGAKTCK